MSRRRSTVLTSARYADHSSPSVWSLITLGLAAAITLWGLSEFALASLQPVVQTLLLALVVIPLMLTHRWWWRQSRQRRAPLVLLSAGIILAILGLIIEAALLKQPPRWFVYPGLLVLMGLAMTLRLGWQRR